MSKKEKTHAIKEDIFGMRLLDKPRLSPSGRYVFFVGHHYDGNSECYDVGSADMSRRPVVLTRRHHHTSEDAFVTWEETLKKLGEIENGPTETDDSKIFIN